MKLLLLTKEILHLNTSMPTVIFGGRSIMILGSFFTSDTGTLQIIKTNTNGMLYENITEKNSILLAKKPNLIKSCEMKVSHESCEMKVLARQ